MIKGTNRSWDPDSTGRGRRWSTKERTVRLGLFTWPAVAVLGASIASAPCLLGECSRCAKVQANETLVGNAGTVKALAFRPDGELLSSVGVDGSMAIWDLGSRPRSPLLCEGIGQIRCVAFSQQSQLLARSSPRAAVALCELVGDEARVLRELSAASSGAACVAFAPDGETLAVGQQDGKITLWDTASGQERSTLKGHTKFVVSIAFAPAGGLLASSSADRSMRIWDLATSKQRVITNSPHTCVVQAFFPDGCLLAQCDQVNPVVRLCDTATGAERALLHGPSGAVQAVAVSTDGKRLAAADFHGTVTFWDAVTLKTQPKRLSHPGVRTLAFAPDGRALATGGFDGTIHLWDVTVLN